VPNASTVLPTALPVMDPAVAKAAAEVSLAREAAEEEMDLRKDQEAKAKAQIAKGGTSITAAEFDTLARAAA
jgi:hypothetical protein